MVKDERKLPTIKIPKYEIILEVWGKYACFTRPEFKVERVSYDIMTPSAARGVLEAIYYKPEFRYIIDEIYIINPIKTTFIRRNEITDKISVSQIKKAKTTGKPIYQNIEETRQRRSALILKDVRYFIKAHIEMTSPSHETNNLTKHYVMFRQRANKGKCFRQPYLGCREFSAYFELHDEITKRPINLTKDLSYMLYDIDYNNNNEPVFFRAYINNGILKVPERLKSINKIYVESKKLKYHCHTKEENNMTYK